jgi:hypothetical protein
MSLPQLFILVSTGQSVANLAPLLEYAQPDDEVLWVESRLARDKGWSNGCRMVLHNHRLNILSPDVLVERINDPTELVRACGPFVEQRRQLGQNVYLVANGGNKLTPIGLIHGFAGLAPCVLYGDERPAVCWTFTDSFHQSPGLHPYECHELDLPDILQASNHVLHGNGHRRIWPGPLPDDVAGEPYGLDPACTALLHADHQAWAACQPSGQSASLRRPRPDPIDATTRALAADGAAGSR